MSCEPEIGSDVTGSARNPWNQTVSGMSRTAPRSGSNVGSVRSTDRASAIPDTTKAAPRTTTRNQGDNLRFSMKGLLPRRAFELTGTSRS
jgi:hypothetical protein